MFLRVREKQKSTLCVNTRSKWPLQTFFFVFFVILKKKAVHFGIGIYHVLNFKQGLSAYHASHITTALTHKLFLHLML